MQTIERTTASEKLQWLAGRFVALGLGFQWLCCVISTIMLIIGVEQMAVFVSPVAWAGGIALIFACIAVAIRMLLDAKSIADYAWAALWIAAALLLVIPGIAILNAWMLTPAGVLGINAWFSGSL